jgi:hypothetical protein
MTKYVTFGLIIVENFNYDLQYSDALLMIKKIITQNNNNNNNLINYLSTFDELVVS